MQTCNVCLIVMNTFGWICTKIWRENTFGNKFRTSDCESINEWVENKNIVAFIEQSALKENVYEDKHKKGEHKKFAKI